MWKLQREPLERLAGQWRENGRQFTPTLVLRQLHIFLELVGQSCVNGRAAGLVGERPAHRRNCLRVNHHGVIIELFR